ncbi:putative Receptor protein kinase [Quillaja saponaria]|uniref:non-specific serine/threonine protein kinase n=1 Tax=Quillaja saponaria TaxID=32244 RepID=A0AAD7QFQ7_QUISA|nr:putative Receptor protein kinase [Quillaja saponaria]
MGVPRPMIEDVEYLEISAGDYHACGLRKPLTGRRRNISLIDCWGYNMTRTHVFDGQIQSISAGSEFNCGLFSQNRTVFCWGDETSSGVISLVPKDMRFQKIAEGGYHVCGILEGVNYKAFCWGRSLDIEEEISVALSSQGNVDLAPNDPLLSVVGGGGGGGVGGKFHAFGIKSNDRGVICWGFIIKPSTPAPSGIKVYEIAAGNYFTCGVLAEKSILPVCWVDGFPTFLPSAVSPGLCKSTTCPPSFYEIVQQNSPCSSLNYRVCMPCSNGCPAEMYQKNSSSPLAELPAGTLGYLDPEYYRLHYLTTKSDVYSFGVLLLEILSGRKAIDMQYEEGNIVEWAVPLIKAGGISTILDPVLKSPSDLEALKRIANVACKCVRMRGKERPSMDKVTTALERTLAQLMGSPCIEQPILPTEVVWGSNRMHKKISI